VLADGIDGMTDPSATRRPLMPCTKTVGGTTVLTCCASPHLVKMSGIGRYLVHGFSLVSTMLKSDGGAAVADRKISDHFIVQSPNLHL